MEGLSYFKKNIYFIKLLAGVIFFVNFHRHAARIDYDVTDRSKMSTFFPPQTLKSQRVTCGIEYSVPDVFVSQIIL